MQSYQIYMENSRTTIMIIKNLMKVFTGKMTVAVVLPLLFVFAAAIPANAQRASIGSLGVYYKNGDATDIGRYCTWDPATLTGDNANRRSAIYSLPGVSSTDPWKLSALIEYDQPYPTATSATSYPNHCLALCMDLYCENTPQAQSTYSIAFPLKNIQFQIFKYYGGKQPENPDTVPPIRTIEMFPMADSQGNPETYKCGSYTCNAASVCDENGIPSIFGLLNKTTMCTPTCSSQTSYTMSASVWKGMSRSCREQLGCVVGTLLPGTKTKCTSENQVTTGTQDGETVYYIPGGVEGTCPFQFSFNNNGARTMTEQWTDPSMQYCTGWDGSYEIAGEFGKTNGTFGYRGYIAADFPGDNIAIENIKFEDVAVYAGGGSSQIGTQYPIQINVTNVHTVRSTPSVVGSITAVEAMPYTLAYRLSKDADVNIDIYDTSVPAPATGILPIAQKRRTLVEWKPRLGEGMKGQDSDQILVEFDSWDGRDDNGRLLPAGNYLANIMARTSDEWPGVDYSRAVTRQVSIDPLKITDITTVPLGKQSTAYATISYVPTEAATIYLNIYTPGTTFDTTKTSGATATGTPPTITPGTGYLVHSHTEQRGSRLNYTTKWDGLCTDATNCNGNTPLVNGRPFTLGAPMIDGDYVYVLWAEIPYTSNYTNAAGAVYTGVKTTDYKVGILPIARGTVDITIQEPQYSTVGSSPTAYGLDPFLFKYSVSRASIVVAEVQNTAGVTVKTLTPAEGISAVSQQMNTLHWNGRDDQGRVVAPGTYMFTVLAKDPMFPEVENIASSIFPVDLFHVVDVSSTDVYGDSTANSTISYYLSRAMNVQVNIYNKDVVIPNYNDGGANWPPRICNTADDGAYFTGGAIDPAKKPRCIYVNDTTFTQYPASAAATPHVRLQPVKTYDHSYTRNGEGMQVTEEWDTLYFNNPSACDGTDITACPYEMVPDGQYPFFIAARSNEPVSFYYDRTTYQPFTTDEQVEYADYIYSTEKPTSHINVTRGPVYFLPGTTVVYPNAPQLFNASSGPTFIPPYEINFAISRAATVEVEVIALQPNVCTVTTAQGTGLADVKNNAVGDVCKNVSTVRIPWTSNFDPDIVRKVYWDGTDNNGYYVKPAIYEIRLTAKNYPDEDLYQPTVRSISQNVQTFQVFDLLEADGYHQSVRNTNLTIPYQLSVPMKVAIQIFKPGTTIYDYSKGTLRDPATGREVTDIHDVLVRSIVGIRPQTTLINELWDGRDYAQQEVPDGNYPFRFVTALTSSHIDSVTGEIIPGDDSSPDAQLWKMNYVADTYQYQTLHRATIAIGDGQFVCEDWERTVFFYPNPFRTATGTLEVTKLPVPGTMSIKLYNLAGDMVKRSGYTCVDANNYEVVMGDSLSFQPDNNISGVKTASMPSLRNAALRCRWDKTNEHGKKVARGVYFGLVDFRAQNGRQHCQKVVKIMIP